MHTLDIPDRNIHVDFPSEIDEMDTRQYLCYLELILKYVSKEITADELKIRLVRELLDIRMSFGFAFLNSCEKEECDTNLIRLSELMDCFIEEYAREGKPVKAFRVSSVRNFVPKILSYYGPGDCFENLTFCEYRLARGYFRSYAQNTREEDLNRLVAVLYRRAKPFWSLRKFLSVCDGEKRVPFTSKSNPLLLERRAKFISRVPFHIRYAVFLYFSGCEDFLRSGKPVIDDVTLDLSVLFDLREGDSAKADVGITGLLYSMAETGVFGTIEQTDNTNLWDILIRIYQVVMQMKLWEEKRKKNDPGS